MIPGLSLEEAKAETQAIEREIAGAFSDDEVASVEQLPEGVLMSCAKDEGYSWAGKIEVHLTEPMEPQRLLERVVSVFEGREGFETEIEEPSAGVPGPTAVIVGEGLLTFIANTSPGSEHFDVVSWSRCFALPDDVSPHGRY